MKSGVRMAAHMIDRVRQTSMYQLWGGGLCLSVCHVREMGIPWVEGLPLCAGVHTCTHALTEPFLFIWT